MIGRIERSADFERVLGRPGRARSPHFAVHHLAANPSPSAWVLSTGKRELSTADSQAAPKLVDDVLSHDPPRGCWAGFVVPKRHAKRSVTRNLLKRQMRAVLAERELRLPAGLWVLRLRSPIDRKAFPSAASNALRDAVRVELSQLLDRALARAAA